MPIICIPPPSGPENTKITKLAFLSRFTTDEAIGIDLASIGATVDAARIRRYLSLVDAATYIDLSSSELEENVKELEVVGLIAEGRASEIICSPIQPQEVPK